MHYRYEDTFGAVKIACAAKDVESTEDIVTVTCVKCLAQLVAVLWDEFENK